jgi:hypothetical protein
MAHLKERSALDGFALERKALEEVAPMEIYTMKRPSLLPAVCAPSAPAMPSRYESVAMTAVKWAPLPQVHQVQIQAELARTSALGGSSNGTTGFAASSKGFVGNEGISVKTDAVGGAPPRGRPV